MSKGAIVALVFAGLALTGGIAYAATRPKRPGAVVAAAEAVAAAPLPMVGPSVGEDLAALGMHGVLAVGKSARVLGKSIGRKLGFGGPSMKQMIATAKQKAAAKKAARS